MRPLEKSIQLNVKIRSVEFMVLDQRTNVEIFHIFCGMRKLKTLHINLDRDKKINDKKTTIDDIESLLKSNNVHRKAETLQYMELSMDTTMHPHPCSVSRHSIWLLANIR